MGGEGRAEPLSRRSAIWGAAIGGLLLVSVISLGLYLSSASFQDRMRIQVVAELEAVTGGHVELRSFTWNLSRLEFVAKDLTIHGLEPAGEAPYAHVDELRVRGRLISLVSARFGLRSVEAERPVFHIMVGADGRTNQPAPHAENPAAASPGAMEKLFDIAVGSLDLRDGELLLNDKKIPLDLDARDVAAQLVYDTQAKQYSGTVRAGSGWMQSPGGMRLPLAGDTEFALSGQTLDLHSLHWRAGGSFVSINGKIEGLSDPNFSLAYQAKLDLQQLEPAANAAQGSVEVAGQASGTEQEYRLSGNAIVRNVDYRAGQVRLTQFDGSTRYLITPNKLWLSDIFARLLGGTARGAIDVTGWRAEGRNDRAHGSADITLTSLDAGRLASAVSTSGLPLAALRLRASANGKVMAKWAGPLSNAAGHFTMGFSPQRREAGTLPIGGEVEGNFRAAGMAIDFSRLDLATPATHINASGTVDARNTQLRVAVTSTDAREWQPLLSALGPRQMLVQLNGPATFSGVVSGPFSAPTMQGHVTAGNLALLIPPGMLTLPGATAMRRGESAHSTQWDSLSADVGYSAKQLSVRNGLLTRGSTSVAVQGNAHLLRGAINERQPFSAQLTVKNLPLASVQAMAGTSYPVTGTLDAALNLSGAGASPAGGGSIDLRGGEAYGEPYRSAHLNVRFNAAQFEATKVSILEDGGQINGSAAFNSQTRAITADLRGTSFDLAHLKRLRNRVESITGKGSFALHASGTVEAPAINGTLSLTGVTAGGEQVGDVTLAGVTQGSDLHLTLTSALRSAELDGKGDVELRGDLPSRFTFDLKHVDVDPLIRAYFSGRITGHSAIDGVLTASGTLRNPREFAAQLTLTSLSANLENVRLASQGPVEVAYADQVASIRSMHLVGDGTDLSVTGTLSLLESKPIDLRSTGTLNMQLLEGFNKDLVAYGAAHFNMVVRGTFSQPEARGRFVVENAGLSVADLPNGLSQMNGTLTFNGSRLEIEKLSARTGGGLLNLSGFIGYQAGLYFDIAATGKDIRLRYPPGVSSVADADLRLAGTTRASLLSGDVTVTRFGVDPHFDFAPYLAHSRQSIEMPSNSALLNSVRLDVHLVTSTELRVETSLAKLSGDADLRIRGTAARPAVLGRVNIAEGDIDFSGTKYHLDRGDVTFINPVRIEPVLNMDASARVRDYDITVGLHGPIEHLQLNYRSDPPLPSADVVALLALGRTREDTELYSSADQQNAFTDTTSNAVLGEALNATVSNRVQQLFGASRIKIDPEVGGPENNPNARITIEQQVSNRVTLTYITNVSQSAQQIIQAEFNISRNTSLIIIRDQNGVLGFDISLRKRKR